MRRFARATCIDELLIKAVNRTTMLDAYRPHLHQQWNEGCHDTAQLHREITVLGFTGDIQSDLTDEDALALKEIRAGCPELDAVTDHVRYFAEMMRDLTGYRLPQWMERVEQDPLPALHSLVNGLRRDQNAVIAGLSSPWSS
ncbi:hypothetical protein OTB20_24980 [Streptomyces sp. H27-H1]|uniref:hypothetical protein n=1 Tax=Streptomyces sp. H27-H1 TaxID=2996461 RepID=UPI00226F1C2E|nr:hypothetical protein [Streptomyces sp. H27-H1]MCY0929395.1 hypothetical protein [Streptomyces sp. H27-H1]